MLAGPVVESLWVKPPVSRRDGQDLLVIVRLLSGQWRIRFHRHRFSRLVIIVGADVVIARARLTRLDRDCLPMQAARQTLEG